MKEFPRIVFFGTPEFAVASLDAIVKAGFPVAGVVTVPDKPAGRGLTLSQSAVKKYAVAHNLPLFQPERLKNDEFHQTLVNLNPDIQVVVAFRMLPELVWGLPPLGTFNLHASLLPQYRGAAPVNWAIINGETVTGVTTFFINGEIDTGAILLQEPVQIHPAENAGELHDRLMNIGADLVVKTVQGIISGAVSPLPQALVSAGSTGYKQAPKIQKSDTIINWDRDIKDVGNQIRGLTPYPGANTRIRQKNGSYLEVEIGSFSLSVERPQEKLIPGEVCTDRKRFLKISAKNGYIDVLSLQPASKNMMNIRDFLNGFGALVA